ncbi:hypothetical protein [Bremerella sp.]|uniref:hypothetical protein n=1 Tax=Bremerella sp. TaxID=2795602 RepID=UPI00391C7B8B
MASAVFLAIIIVIALPFAIAAHDVSQYQAAKSYEDATSFPDTPIESPVEDCSDCSKEMSPEERNKALNEAIFSTARDDVFQSQVDSAFRIFGDYSGSIRNIVLSIPHGGMEKLGQDKMAEKYYNEVATPMICHGIAAKAAKLINESKIDGIKKASVVTKHEPGQDAHYRTKIEYEDGSVAVLDWHETLDSYDPNVYQKEEDLEGWEEDTSYN